MLVRKGLITKANIGVSTHFQHEAARFSSSSHTPAPHVSSPPSSLCSIYIFESHMHELLDSARYSHTIIDLYLYSFTFHTSTVRCLRIYLIVYFVPMAYSVPFLFLPPGLYSFPSARVTDLSSFPFLLAFSFSLTHIPALPSSFTPPLFDSSVLRPFLTLLAYSLFHPSYSSTLFLLFISLPLFHSTVYTILVKTSRRGSCLFFSPRVHNIQKKSIHISHITYKCTHSLPLPFI